MMEDTESQSTTSQLTTEQQLEILQNSKSEEDFAKNIEILRNLSPDNDMLCNTLSDLKERSKTEDPEKFLGELKDLQYYQTYVKELFESCKEGNMSDSFVGILNQLVTLPNQGINKLSYKLKIPKLILKKYLNGTAPTQEHFMKIFMYIDKYDPKKDETLLKKIEARRKQKRERILKKIEKDRRLHAWKYNV